MTSNSLMHGICHRVCHVKLVLCVKISLITEDIGIRPYECCLVCNTKMPYPAVLKSP